MDQGGENPGTIVVNIADRFLYAVEADGWATRYGVAVGEEGLTFKGRATVGRKEIWPPWTPTGSMMKRKPLAATRWRDPWRTKQPTWRACASSLPGRT